MSPVWALKHRPWPLLTAIAPKLPMNEAVEEESTPYTASFIGSLGAIAVNSGQGRCLSAQTGDMTLDWKVAILNTALGHC
jgi:hypothetical protein